MGLFDAINGFLDFLASVFPNLVDTAEFGKIGKYYAVESMLARPRIFISWLRLANPLTGLSATLPAQVMDPATGRYEPDLTPSYGTDTLRAFYAKVCGLAYRFLHCAHPPTDLPGASAVRLDRKPPQVAKEGMAGQELGDAAIKVVGQK